MPTVVSVFGLEPFRIGGSESFARELSVRLGELGWRHVLCWLTEPLEGVRRFLELPNVAFELVSDLTWSNPRAATQLLRVLGKYDPEILHLHFTAFSSPHPWLAKCVGVQKVFFTDHTSPPENHVMRRAPLWKRLVARVLNWPICGVICVSDYGRRRLTERDLLPARRIERIYNGVDLRRVEQAIHEGSKFRRKYGVPPGCPLVVQVSWIVPEKGISDLIEAARLVLARHPDAQFLLVGEGAYREAYTKLAQERGLGEHVTWTGLIEDPLADGVFAAADVVCQASRWEEVFGWVIAEAMSFARPVVATRVGGIPELVLDGTTGFLVDRGDTEAMAQKISTLLDDARLRQSLGEAGRLVAGTKFGLEKNVAALVKLYGISSARSSPMSFRAG
jgi:glycosyltransferase involved in cell wall biosynthesis